MKRKAPVRKGPNPKVVAVFVMLALIAGYFLFGKETPTTARAMNPGLPPGELSGVAPEFMLSDIQGGKVSLSDFRGKVVILDFWATWCPPCKREIPDFINLQAEYGSKGLQIVGIALDEPGKVQQFARDNGMNYPVLLGTDDIATRYGGISGIPTTFVLDRNGKIAARFEGFRPRGVFEGEVKKLL